MESINTYNQDEVANSGKKFLDTDFEQWVDDLLARQHVPGVSVAIVNENTVTSNGYGFARLPDTPATADTLYPMASTSKAFTAALTGFLIEDGATVSSSTASGNEKRQKVQWSTPICQILAEDFVTSDQYITQNTTIEDALSHRTGLPGHEYLWGPWLGPDTAALTRTLRHLGPIIEPFRCKFQYNNIMYGVVGQVVEKLTGRDFKSVMKERIWDPLGMSSTFWGIEGARDAFKGSQSGNLDFARGYFWVGTKNKTKEACTSGEAKSVTENVGYYVPEAHLSMGSIGPAGAQISSVKDYAKWIMALLEASKPPGKITGAKEESSSGAEKSVNPISHDLWRNLTTPRMFQIPPMTLFPNITPLPTNAHLTPQTYALGWSMDPYMYPGHAIVHHAGGILAFGAHVCLVPNLQFGVVAVGNSGLPANEVAEAICKKLIGRKLGLTKELRSFGVQSSEAKNEDPSQTSNATNTAEDSMKVLRVNSLTATMPSAQEERIATSAGDVDVNQAQLVGQYTHPAYGIFVVSQTTEAAALQSKMPNLDSIEIIRKQGKKEVDQDCKGQDQDQSHKSDGSGKSPLSILPLAPRSIQFQLLLHSPKQRDGNLVYDLEKLLARGDLSQDKFPELDPGYGHEDDVKYPCKREWVWESQEMIKQGAVVQYATDESCQIRQLGLQLFRSDVPEESPNTNKRDNSLQDGWEDKMVWFQKVHDE